MAVPLFYFWAYRRTENVSDMLISDGLENRNVTPTFWVSAKPSIKSESASVFLQADEAHTAVATSTIMWTHLWIYHVDVSISNCFIWNKIWSTQKKFLLPVNDIEMLSFFWIHSHMEQKYVYMIVFWPSWESRFWTVSGLIYVRIIQQKTSLISFCEIDSHINVIVNK